MVKDHHKEYHLEDLNEGNTRMVDSNVNPNKDDYDDDFEHGIDDKLQAGTRRWTLDTYKGRNGDHKTPKLPNSIKELKQMIKEEIRNFLL